MKSFKLELSKTAYQADFVLYGSAALLLSLVLLLTAPRTQALPLAALVMAGLLGWTAVEYGLHRFLLHGVQPFRRWHAEHHRRPSARIGTPTVLSGSLIAALVFLPALLIGDLWSACALTLGLVGGYLAYALSHHAIHHWRADSRWLKRRKAWHARHHHRAGLPLCYGVTTGFWDRVFGSGGGAVFRAAEPLQQAEQHHADARKQQHMDEPAHGVRQGQPKSPEGQADRGEGIDHLRVSRDRPAAVQPNAR